MSEPLFKRIARPPDVCVECQNDNHLDCEGGAGGHCLCSCSMQDPVKQEEAEIEWLRNMAQLFSVCVTDHE